MNASASSEQAILEIASATGRKLTAASAHLGAGIHVFLGAVNDGTHELASFVTGQSRPRSGRIRVEGLDPYRSPSVRRRMASVFVAGNTMPLARTLERSLAMAMAAHGCSVSPLTLLNSAGLASWARRSLGSLDDTERRTISMLVALSLDKPVALVLEEPLSVVYQMSRLSIAAALRDRAALGAVVICLTSSLRVARELAPQSYTLSDGRLSSRSLLGPGPGSVSFEWVVRTPASRELSRLLVGIPEVWGTHYDEARHPGAVRVLASRDPKVSLAIARAAIAGGVRVDAIDVRPSFDQVRWYQRIEGNLTQDARPTPRECS